MKTAFKRVFSFFLCAVLIVTAFAGCSKKNKEKSEKDKQAYVSYLKKKIIPEFGLFDVKNAKPNSVGVVSGLIRDLDGDGEDDMLAVIAGRNGKNKNILSLTNYSRDDDGDINHGDSKDIGQEEHGFKIDVKPETTTTTTTKPNKAADDDDDDEIIEEPVSTEIASEDDPDYNEDTDDYAEESTTELDNNDSDEADDVTTEPETEPEETTAESKDDEDEDEDKIQPNASIAYLAEKDDETYIISEYVTWDNDETALYSCKVSRINSDKELEELYNINIEILEDDKIIVYSSALPDDFGKNFDSSDFDADKAGIDADDLSDINILYFSDEEYKFDEHFTSENEAVSEFLNTFGIQKNNAFEINDNGYALINSADDDDMIFSYDYHIEKSSDGAKTVCTVIDYTGLNEMVQTTEEEIETETLDVESDEVKELMNTVQFDDYTYCMLLEEGEFDVSTASNDRILGMAVSSTLGFDTALGKMLPTEPSDYAIETVYPKTALTDAVKYVFGEDVEYQLEDFEIYDKDCKFSEFFCYSDLRLSNAEIDGDNLVLHSTQGGGGDMPFIMLYSSRAEKEDDVIKVYVKKCFVDTEYNESDNDFIYKYCVDYKDNSYSETLYEDPANDLYNDESIRDDSFKEGFKQNIYYTMPKVASSFDEKLSECCFEFKKDSKGEYHFSAFKAEV